MLFSKKRKDAKWVKPNDSIGAIVPYIMPKRTDAEVSSRVEIDITNLCNFIDDLNKNGNLEYKMTYFHGIAACVGMTLYNRPFLNRFIKNKRLYERYEKSIAFVAKNKFEDTAEERLISLVLKPDDTGIDLSKKMAIDIFKVKGNKDNNMDDVLSFFASFPKFLLSLIVKCVFFLDKHGINPKAFTEGDTNYATVILSNLGSIKCGSCYHHLNEYGTNSIVITIGTIKEENGKKTVDLWSTLDERIADGFYFAKSIQFAEYIAKNPELLKEKLSTKVNFDL